MKSLTYFLGIFAIITNAGDLLTTLFVLSLGGSEANPLFSYVGATYFFLIKIMLPTFAIIICLVIAEKADNSQLTNINIFLGILGFAFLIFITNNLIVISQLI